MGRAPPRAPAQRGAAQWPRGGGRGATPKSAQPRPGRGWGSGRRGARRRSPPASHSAAPPAEGAKRGALHRCRPARAGDEDTLWIQEPSPPQVRRRRQGSGSLACIQNPVRALRISEEARPGACSFAHPSIGSTVLGCLILRSLADGEVPENKNKTNPKTGSHPLRQSHGCTT